MVPFRIVGLLERLFSNGSNVVAGGYTEQAQLADPFKIATVVAGRQVLADLVSSFPLKAYSRDTGKELPTSEFLRRPNPRQPSCDTFEMIVNSFTRHGGAWLLTTAVGSNGFPLAIEVIDHDRITYTLNATRTRFASVLLDGQRSLTSNEIQYVPFVLESSSVVGTSPLVTIDAALVQLNTAMAYSAFYYGSASTPPYALVSKTRLGTEKSAEMLAAWQSAREHSRPAVISGDLELKTFAPTSASDALVLEAIQYLDATVARVLGIPPTWLNTQALSSLTYSTSRDESKRFINTTLRTSYLTRIEAAMSQYLPRGQVAMFDTTGLTRLDVDAQVQVDADLIAAGIMTVDEIRAQRGLNPIATPTPTEAPNV